MGLMSRRKGKSGELELSKYLAKVWGVKARRGQQFSGSPDSPDVVIDIPGIHLESKRVEALRLIPSLEQAKADAGDNVPVVQWRCNRNEWITILYTADVPRFAGKLLDANVTERGDGSEVQSPVETRQEGS